MIKPKKTLQNIEPYSTDRFYVPCNLKLDSNENPYGPSPLVLEAVRNFDPEKIKFYPAYGALIDKLAAHFSAGAENFLLTNGCDEAINVVLNAFLDEGDEALSFSPTFSMPKLYCDIIGAKFVQIPYSSKWNFDCEVYSKYITPKTKILYLTSPNNPTGETVPVETVSKLLSLYKDKLLVLDCTYLNYSSTPIGEYFELVKKNDNLVIVKSFSKDFALAGLRLGYIYAGKNIINEARKVISPYSVNSVALHAGLAALSDLEYFKGVKEKITKSKQLLVEGLNSLGYKAFNTEANFVLCDFGPHADFVFNKLSGAGVKVKYFKGVEALKNTFRITAPRLEDVEGFLNLFKKKPLFVFDLDGVVFDVRNSYRAAIKKTYEHFTGKICTEEEVQKVKNRGNMSNDWDVTACLIKEAGVSVEYNELIKVFQDLFYAPEKEALKGLIDNEALVLGPEFFEMLSKFGDCAVFTGRPREEAFYSLEKFGVKKYFSYFVCNEDVEGNQKPSPFGLNKIKGACPSKEIVYFGDTVDDIKAGKDAGVRVFGVIPPGAECVEETARRLYNFGAEGVIDNWGAFSPEEILKKEKVCK